MQTEGRRAHLNLGPLPAVPSASVRPLQRTFHDVLRFIHRILTLEFYTFPAILNDIPSQFFDNILKETDRFTG